MFSSSLGGGLPGSWTPPLRIQQGTDRGLYAAPAISPDGNDVYVTYNAFTTPWRFNTTDARGLVGVVLHADVADGGSIGSFSLLHRGTVGDPRGSSQNNLQAEFLGDYVYTAATNDHAVAVWNDARNAAPCAAVNLWRGSLRDTGDPIPAGATREREGDEDTDVDVGETGVPAPAPSIDCPTTGSLAFGNTDIYGGSYTDPTAEVSTTLTTTATTTGAATTATTTGTSRGQHGQPPAKGKKK